MARRCAVLSAVLGAIGLIAWILPWFGFPVGFYGLIQGLRAKYDLPKTATGLAWCGVALCSISMMLSIANLVIFAFVGNSGKNPLAAVLLQWR